MKMYETSQSVEKYLNVPLECSCGRTHFAPIKAVKIGKGALNSLTGYVRDFDYHRPYILCDKITYQVAGQRCQQLLGEAGLAPTVLIIKHQGFDEATLGEIVINKPDDCDLMIGVSENPESVIAKQADIYLKVKVEQEPCRFNMLATASTLAVIATFDAICIALMQMTGYTREQFAVIHPGGAVGERLLNKRN